MPENSLPYNKPAWLNKKIDLKKCSSMERLLAAGGLNTVCQSAMCPNISECFGEGVATFLILGTVCTRGCKFCAVDRGVPGDPDTEEPVRVALAVKKLHLKHVVVTSVTRDDLDDGGALTFAETTNAIKAIAGDVTVELLVPDFAGQEESVRTVLSAEPDIFGHNVETVPRIYKEVRKGALYERSLGVLAGAKRIDKKARTKSGIMLGLGETEDEVITVMKDLRKASCDYLSIGQYLAPSKKHYPVKEYIRPERFSVLKSEAEKLGFLYVESGPYVRSSYHAAQYRS